MLKAEIIYHKCSHVSRLLTALHILEKQGILSCKYIDNKKPLIISSHPAVVEMRIADKRIIFDLGDRSALNHPQTKEFLSSVDMYFERSHEDWSQNKHYSDLSSKVKPFGFDYYASYPGNPAQKKPYTAIGMLKNIFKDITGISRCTNIKAFEAEADYKDKDIRILFMTRLWDPSEINLSQIRDKRENDYVQYLFYERKKINSDRIKICSELRKIYQDNFIGGIQSSPYSAKQCPDLIIPPSRTRKSSYLKIMKSSDICIGSAGLHKSIGWKTGEYVAASRAIVCETPVYLLPGNFAKDINYLPYNNVEECLSAVEKLYHNPTAIFEMKKANEKYYQEYLKPDVQLLNALRQCGLSLQTSSSL